MTVSPLSDIEKIKMQLAELQNSAFKAESTSKKLYTEEEISSLISSAVSAALAEREASKEPPKPKNLLEAIQYSTDKETYDWLINNFKESKEFLVFIELMIMEFLSEDTGKDICNKFIIKYKESQPCHK